MHCLMIGLILLFTNDVFGKLTLKKGESVAVQFNGNNLKIRLKNPDENVDILALCFGSFPGTTNSYCPPGYAVLYFSGRSNFKTVYFNITRQGNTHPSFVNFEGKLRLNDDNSLDVLLAEEPSGATVTLMNAEIQEKHQETKLDVNKFTIGLIIGGIVFVLLVMVAIFLIWFFIYRKKVSHNTVPLPVPNSVKTPQKSVEATTFASQNVQKCQQLPKHAATKQDSTVVTKQTTSSTTKVSDEKVQQVVVSKPVVTESRVSRSMSKESRTTSNETRARTSESAAVKTPMPTTSLSTAKSAPNLNTQKLISLKKPKSAHSPNLPVDVTQSPTHTSPSTEPTPEFSYGLVANGIAATSPYKFRAYLPSNEAPKPGSSRQQRSGRIVDEVVEFNRSLETYTCFAQREQYLSGHDHMMITERIKFTLHHKLSDGERALLKAAPTDAPRLADILVQQIDAIIKEHCFEHDAYKFDMQQEQSFWRIVNNYNTMASVGCVLMYRLLPAIFSLKEKSLSDSKVRKMPLCGLYTLLLDSTFPNSFREDLAFEVRRRAADVIPRVQKAALRDTCFPATYLTLVYYKNKRSFVQGLEVHTKDRKK